MQLKWMLVWAAVLGVSAADSVDSDDSSVESDDSPICSEPNSPTNFTIANLVGNKHFVKYYRSNRNSAEADGVTFVFVQDGPDNYNLTVNVVRENENGSYTKEEFYRWKETPSKHELFMDQTDEMTIYSIPYFDSTSSVLHLCTTNKDNNRKHFVQVLSTGIDIDPVQALEEAKRFLWQESL